MNEEHLRSHFGQFGALSDVYIPKDMSKKEHRGFGFVTYESDAVAEKVAATPLHTIDGVPVQVDRAAPKRDDGPGGGRGGGGAAHTQHAAAAHAAAAAQAHLAAAHGLHPHPALAPPPGAEQLEAHMMPVPMIAPPIVAVEQQAAVPVGWSPFGGMVQDYGFGSPLFAAAPPGVPPGVAVNLPPGTAVPPQPFQAVGAPIAPGLTHVTPNGDVMIQPPPTMSAAPPPAWSSVVGTQFAPEGYR